MAAKLKDLKITSTDLVKQGANPEARIRLFKRRDVPDEAFDEFGTENSSDINQKEELDTMKIDKGKMTQEEQAILAEFEKKYGIAEPAELSAPGSASNGAEQTTAAIPDIHPEVRKTLVEMEAVRKAQTAQIEELKKSLEIERLTSIAKKYEIIGKKPGELAPKLYGLKKAGGTAYDDYVALLDEHLNTVEKGGIFAELGRNTDGGINADGGLNAKAAEIKKANADMSDAEAVVKAYETYPDLAARYEQTYRGRV